MKLSEAGEQALAHAANATGAGASLDDPQRDLPRIARDVELVAALNGLANSVATQHHLLEGDARKLKSISSASIHLVVTSPPYWTLKRYNDVPGQLGHLTDYAEFLASLDEVWRECYRLLVPGGRMVVVVGDVCLSRRQNHGRHMVIPLHSSIAERAVAIGFDPLAPIIWHKIANAIFEAEGNGAGFLGKPYEPNAVIKNDVEYLLMFRRSGGYRSPDLGTRLLSLISAPDHRQWFRQIWAIFPEHQQGRILLHSPLS